MVLYLALQQRQFLLRYPSLPTFLKTCCSCTASICACLLNGSCVLNFSCCENFRCSTFLSSLVNLHHPLSANCVCQCFACALHIFSSFVITTGWGKFRANDGYSFLQEENFIAAVRVFWLVQSPSQHDYTRTLRETYLLKLPTHFSIGLLGR